MVIPRPPEVPDLLAGCLLVVVGSALLPPAIPAAVGTVAVGIGTELLAKVADRALDSVRARWLGVTRGGSPISVPPYDPTDQAEVNVYAQMSVTFAYEGTPSEEPTEAEATPTT